MKRMALFAVNSCKKTTCDFLLRDQCIPLGLEPLAWIKQVALCALSSGKRFSALCHWN